MKNRIHISAKIEYNLLQKGMVHLLHVKRDYFNKTNNVEIMNVIYTDIGNMISIAEQGENEVLRALIKGGASFDAKEETLTALERVGIEQGFFKVTADGKTHHYILKDNGDVFNVYGKNYAIDETGHIHVNIEELRTPTRVIYPDCELGM